MGRFFVWLSHREPESTHLTGFSAQFADENISARISAHGLNPVASRDRQAAYRTMIEQLANAMLGSPENPMSITENVERRSDISAYQGDWPLRVMPAQVSTARESRRGVEMTVYASVHGSPPDAHNIQIPMTPGEARQLAEDLLRAVAAAEKK